MLEDRGVKPSCGNVGEEEGVGLVAGKGSEGPCYEADSSRQGSLLSWVDHLPIEGGRRGEMGEGLP